MPQDSHKPIGFGFAKKHQIVVKDEDNDVVLYCGPDIKIDSIMEVQRYLGIVPNIKQTSKEHFEQILNEYYENIDVNTTKIAENIEEHLNLNALIEELPTTQDLLDSQEDAPIIQLINSLLSEAIQMNASDIHFEIFKDQFQIRFRIDGVLHEIYNPPRNIASLLISRIKVMAKLDIAEKKIPQDGRINLKVANREIDVRVSILPSNHGERAVLRILDKKNAKLELAALGANKEIVDKIESMITKPNGIVLVTGPTGSGKSTTLYAAISRLNDVSRNILTVEDPIEYDLPGIGQTQVNDKVGMTFAKGLRAILRQDPDIIMVGEIRDKETADIAIESSLTGHLVLSTLHTNSAVGAIVRLQDMGVQPFLLASSLIGVVAQRLVRKLCPKCKQPADDKTIADAQALCNMKSETIYIPKGCMECNQLGYKGRVGIYEIIFIDKVIRKMIHDKNSEDDIKNYCTSKFDSLLKSGCQRVLQGHTSLEEVLRVANANSKGTD